MRINKEFFLLISSPNASSQVSFILLSLLLQLKATDAFDYLNLLIKVNILILVRVIKEMTTMQSTGEGHIQQIR